MCCFVTIPTLITCIGVHKLDFIFNDGNWSSVSDTVSIRSHSWRRQHLSGHAQHGQDRGIDTTVDIH